GVEGDRQTDFVCVAGQAVATLGIYFRKIRRAGTDVNREYRSHGCGSISGLVLREAFDRAGRHGGIGGSLFYFTEAGAGGCAGDVVFVLYDAVAGDSIYGGTFHRGLIRP